MTQKINHQHAAHCETGVMSTMMRHHGVDISEPMAFGLSSSLSFAYLPFIKLNGMPLIGYRMPPRSVIKGLQKRLNFRMQCQTFSDQEKGMLALDQLLDQGEIVAQGACPDVLNKENMKQVFKVQAEIDRHPFHQGQRISYHFNLEAEPSTQESEAKDFRNNEQGHDA